MSRELASEVMRIVEDLDASQLKLEKDAFDVINSSDTSLNLVKDGIKEIEVLIGKIDDLNASVAASQKCIEQMKEVSNVIADFAGVIAGIANKTNILSLNATIEAARAGEQGRGFAVVAKEVQNLANQSKNSSSEIANKISEVQQYVDGMVESMKGIYENAEQQNKISTTVNNLLGKILEAAKTANDVSRNIENEIAYQRDITDKARTTINLYND
ncbi:MAG: chemotaxis protein [Lachnospiraceae bacterium]|nr:chemotaxis protein [Lachnospiraceae bacterium]